MPGQNQEIDEMKMTRKKMMAVVIVCLIVTCSLLMLEAQKMFHALPEPGPAPPPERNSGANPFVALSQTQGYSASRVSSYNKEGGPRDNFWIPTTGEEVTLAEIDGPGAITHIWTTFRGTGRDLIIRFYWEGQTHPSIEAPMGDFFGVALGMDADVHSYPIQVSSNGRSRNCWWYMPFNTSARVTVACADSEFNRNRKVESLYFYIDYRAYKKPVKDIHYLHARFQETEPAQRGKPVTFLDIQGAGHFVGVVMGHRARIPQWFGEGDDIITVDGKVSFAGTGTEDYFCDAWGFRQFSDLYHGVPAIESRGIGARLTAYRFHIMDPIPFRKSFKFEIEHWPWISPWPNTSRDYFSSLGFWYQKDLHAAWPRLTEIVSNGPWDPAKGRWHVPGSLEAEDLGLLGFNTRLGDTARPEVRLEMPNLSGDRMIRFDSGGEGYLDLTVPAEKDGTYDLTVYFVRAPEYGKVRLYVNDRLEGDPADTFLETDDLTRPIWPPKAFAYPSVKLKKGMNVLRFEINSKNPDSKGFVVGIDCIKLETTVGK